VVLHPAITSTELIGRLFSIFVTVTLQTNTIQEPLSLTTPPLITTILAEKFRSNQEPELQGASDAIKLIPGVAQVTSLGSIFDPNDDSAYVESWRVSGIPLSWV